MKSRKKRIKTLDAFRGLAALAVVLRHYTTIFRENYEMPFSSVYDFKYGYLGVELFFMISGFVILMSLTKLKSSKEFLLRRVIRLYPTYWFAICLTLLVILVTGFNDLKIPFTDVLFNFTMVQSFFAPVINIKNLDGVYWTLTIEMFFYMFMAVIMFFKMIKHIKWIGIIWVFWSVVSLYFNLSIFKIGILLNYWWSPLFYGGILFYIIWSDEKEKKNVLNHILIFLTLCSYLVLCSIKSEEVLKSNFIDSVAGLLFFLLFYLFVYGKLNWLGENRMLLFLGKISYPWYLIHQNIGYIILYYFFIYKNNESGLYVIIPIIITIVMAYLINLYIEKPSYLYLKRKLLKTH